MIRIVFGLACVAALCGCPNTDTAVFVEPSIDSPSVSVMSGALGATVKGGFALDLHLGARASGTSSVNVTSFSLVDASNADIVSPLKLTADQPLPVSVAQDSTVTVSFTFDQGEGTTPSADGTKLCAGQITVRGSIDDSLQDTPTSVGSAPFTALCSD